MKESTEPFVFFIGVHELDSVEGEYRLRANFRSKNSRFFPSSVATVYKPNLEEVLERGEGVKTCLLGICLGRM
jgi:hypothetical protein